MISLTMGVVASVTAGFLFQWAFHFEVDGWLLIFQWIIQLVVFIYVQARFE